MSRDRQWMFVGVAFVVSWTVVILVATFRSTPAPGCPCCVPETPGRAPQPQPPAVYKEWQV